MVERKKKERQYLTAVKSLTCSVTFCRQHRYCSDSSRPDRRTPTDCYRILQAGPFLVRRRPITELCGNLKNKRSIYQKSYNIDIVLFYNRKYDLPKAVGVQLTPASSLWEHDWFPHSFFNRQKARLSSDPLQSGSMFREVPLACPNQAST